MTLRDSLSKQKGSWSHDAETGSEQTDVSLARQKDVSLARQKDVSLERQKDVSLARQKDVSLERQKDVSLARQKDVSTSFCFKRCIEPIYYHIVRAPSTCPAPVWGSPIELGTRSCPACFHPAPVGAPLSSSGPDHVQPASAPRP